MFSFTRACITCHNPITHVVGDARVAIVGSALRARIRAGENPDVVDVLTRSTSRSNLYAINGRPC